MRWRVVQCVRQQPLVVAVLVLVVVVVRQWSQLRAGHLLSLAAARERSSVADTVTSVRQGSTMQASHSRGQQLSDLVRWWWHGGAAAVRPWHGGAASPSRPRSCCSCAAPPCCSDQPPPPPPAPPRPRHLPVVARCAPAISTISTIFNLQYLHITAGVRGAVPPI